MQALDFRLDETHLRAMFSAVAAVDVDDALVLDTTNMSVEDTAMTTTLPATAPAFRHGSPLTV
jgi:hypothetical protein